jgi:peptide/nickel transport system substrate-binding protein
MNGQQTHDEIHVASWSCTLMHVIVPTVSTPGTSVSYLVKRRLAALLAAAAVIVLAAGCSSSTAAPSSSDSTTGSNAAIPLLRVGINYTVTTLNPMKNGYQFEIQPLLLETLLKPGPQGQLEPDLATSVTNPNPVTYIYHLRHGVKFWDGTPLTSADVVYSWDQERAPSSTDTTDFAGVKTIEPDGPYTVVVTLSQPNAAWQYTPANQDSAVFEMKFAQQHASTFGDPGVLVMGTGPWEINSLDPAKGAVLTANPHWWGGKVNIQRITFTSFSSETSLALAFRAGEVDIDPFIVDLRSFAADSGAKIISVDSDSTGVFAMNTEQPGWDDVHVRRAVAYAIDRADVIAANGGYASPIYTMIPPVMLRTIASSGQVTSLVNSLPTYQYDLAKAKQEMAESAYPHGFSTTILEYTDDGQAVNEGEAIAAELQPLGIHAQIKAITLNAWAAIETGPAAKRMSTFLETGGSSSPDVSGYDFMLGSQNTAVGEWNIADYTPSAVNSLMAAGIATTNPAKRFPIYTQLLRQLASDEPYVPIYMEDEGMAISSRFTVGGYSQFFTSTPYALDIKAAG